MKWLLILHMGSVYLPPVADDGTLNYRSHFATSQKCIAAAKALVFTEKPYGDYIVMAVSGYGAVCKRAIK